MSDDSTSSEYTNEIESTSEGSSDGGGGESDSGSPGRWKKHGKTIAWIALSVFCLVLFTLMKLPEDRIQNFVQGTLTTQLSAHGVSLTAAESKVSLGFGVSYQMKDITLNFVSGQSPVHIDELSVSPSILSMIAGRMGGTILMTNKGGRLKASFSQPMSGKGPISFSFGLSSLDLGALGILPMMANVKGSAIANGQGSIQGDLNAPSSLNGNINLDLSKIVVDQQTVLGFTLPRLGISDANADIDIGQGKANIKTLQLGKPGSSADDIRGKITGDVTLGRNWAFSTLDLKADFSLSQTILKSFILLEAILGPGKQSDGSYLFQITGPLSSPTPAPIHAGAH